MPQNQNPNTYSDPQQDEYCDVEEYYDEYYNEDEKEYYDEYYDEDENHSAEYYGEDEDSFEEG